MIREGPRITKFGLLIRECTSQDITSNTVYSVLTISLSGFVIYLLLLCGFIILKPVYRHMDKLFPQYRYFKHDLAFEPTNLGRSRMCHLICNFPGGGCIALYLKALFAMGPLYRGLVRSGDIRVKIKACGCGATLTPRLGHLGNPCGSSQCVPIRRT